MYHDPRFSDFSILERLPCPLNSMCTVERPRKSRMQIDNRYLRSLDRSEKRRCKDMHPSCTNNQCRSLNFRENILREVRIVHLSSNFLIRILRWDLIFVGFECSDCGWYSDFFRSLETGFRFLSEIRYHMAYFCIDPGRRGKC